MVPLAQGPLHVPVAHPDCPIAHWLVGAEACAAAAHSQEARAHDCRAATELVSMGQSGRRMRVHMRNVLRKQVHM